MPGFVDAISEWQTIAEIRRELRRLRSTAIAQTPIGEYNEYTLASSSDSAHTLTYIPALSLIPIACLNGLPGRYGTDYTVDFTTGIVTWSATKVAGDILSVFYQTTGDLVALSGTADVGAALDNFNRVNSPTTLNPASDGGAWVVDFGGVFGIAGNTAYNVSAVVGVGPVSGPNVAIARRDVGQAAMEVIVDVTRSSTAGGSAFVACYDAVATSCYEVFYDSSSSFGSLSRIAADGHPGLGVSLGFTAWTGGTTSLKLRRDSAGVVTAYQLVGGVWVSKGTFTDTFPLPGTWAGFGTAPTSPGVDHWDNFSATPL